MTSKSLSFKENSIDKLNLWKLLLIYYFCIEMCNYNICK